MGLKYGDLSPERKKHERDVARMANLDRGCRLYKQGLKANIPTLRIPMIGAESVYLKHGIKPDVDVFIPKIGMHQDVIDAARIKFNNKRSYTKNSMVEVSSTKVIGNLIDIMGRVAQKNKDYPNQ